MESGSTKEKWNSKYITEQETGRKKKEKMEMTVRVHVWVRFEFFGFLNFWVQASQELEVWLCRI